MIQPNELRIGNIVTHDDYSSELFTVESIYIEEQEGQEVYIVDTVGGKNGIWTNPLELVNSVLLTKETLFTCGFEPVKEHPDTFIKEIKTYPINASIKLYAYLTDGVVTSMRLRQGQTRKTNMIDITSLHQLQNLYFALTGKELEVEL